MEYKSLGKGRIRMDVNASGLWVRRTKKIICKGTANPFIMTLRNGLLRIPNSTGCRLPPASFSGCLDAFTSSHYGHDQFYFGSYS